jgi:NAD(P)-dependent dehydrogenase (short-subunit alcohol dehydrogenase family)
MLMWNVSCEAVRHHANGQFTGSAYCQARQRLPLSVMTEVSSRIVTKAQSKLASRNLQKRFLRPEEVANTVAWLCLPGSEAITGQAIAVAGGELM